MSNQKHTPGHWTAFGRTVYAADTMVSLSLSEYDAEESPTYQAADNLLSDDEALANAQLIAAAPDLLAALKSVLAHAEDMTCELNQTDDLSDYAYIQTARSAIAQAEKGQS